MFWPTSSGSLLPRDCVSLWSSTDKQPIKIMSQDCRQGLSSSIFSLTYSIINSSSNSPFFVRNLLFPYPLWYLEYSVVTNLAVFEALWSAFSCCSLWTEQWYISRYEGWKISRRPRQLFTRKSTVTCLHPQSRHELLSEWHLEKQLGLVLGSDFSYIGWVLHLSCTWK